VVTHGTYTAEETAYFLHLVVDTSKPVVLTCSQRKHGMLGNDGDRNLYDALVLAASPQAREAGVLVTVNEEIHSAREVVKLNRRPGGFGSPVFGPLGFVDHDQISIFRKQLRQHTFSSDLRRIEWQRTPRVGVFGAHPGAPGGLVDGMIEKGAEALIVHGFTYAGTPSPEQTEACLRALSAGIPVALVSRGREGRIPLPEQPDGFIRADSLALSKAVVLLTAALGSGMTDAVTIQNLYSTH
jgi:L-asparaginase